MNEGLFHAINGLAGQSGVLDAAGRLGAQDLLYVLAAVLLVLGLSTWRSSHRTGSRMAIAGLLAVLTSLAIAVVLSRSWYEGRPFITDSTTRLLVAHADDSGFPSDHVAVAAAAATVGTLYRRSVGWLLGILVFAIAVSRVFVGVHYPGDVAAASVIGVTMGFVADFIVRRLIRSWGGKTLPGCCNKVGT